MSKNEVTEQSIATLIEERCSAPRVTPGDVAREIKAVHFFRGDDGVYGARIAEHGSESFGYLDPSLASGPLPLITFCVLELHNGFTVVGKSACASAENFDAEIGRQVARRDAEAQIWPLLGFRLRDRITAGFFLTGKTGAYCGVPLGNPHNL